MYRTYMRENAKHVFSSLGHRRNLLRWRHHRPWRLGDDIRIDQRYEPILGTEDQKHFW